jgi:uncharacterized protein (DUF3820 family)
MTRVAWRLGSVLFMTHDDTGLQGLELGFSQAHLLKLAHWKMPFGKYTGTVLIDLPEEYLFWFAKNDFPKGELGELMKLCLELKIEGLDSVVKPLKRNDQPP